MSPSSNDPPSNRSPRGSSWSHVVRGDSNGDDDPSSPPPSASAPARSEPPDRDPEEPSNGGENSSNVKKSPWNRLSNGSTGVGPVMGADSWPALSQSAKRTPKSAASPSDSMKTDSDGSASLPLSPPPAAAFGSDHQMKVIPRNSIHSPKPSHQKPIQPGSTELQLNGGLVSPKKPHLLPEKPSGNSQEPSPREMHNNRNNYHGSKGNGFPTHSHGGPDHHRPFHRRGNNGGGGGGPHNSVRRDPDRAAYSGGWNTAPPRYMPPPLPPGGHYPRLSSMRPHPPPLPPGAIQYMQPPPPPPPPMRPFMNRQMGYIEIPPPLYYVPVAPPPPLPSCIPPLQAGHAMMLHTPENPCAMVLRQIEYYFSAQNLPNDNYLRSHMDDQGWVPVSLIAGFKRVKQLTHNIPNVISFIIGVLQTSEVVEVQGERIRRRGDWSSWVLHRMQNLALEGNPSDQDSSTDQHP